MVDDGAGGMRDFDPETDCDQETAAAMKEAITNGSATTLPYALAAGDALIYSFVETTPNRQESDTVTVKTSFGTTDLADATAGATCPDRVFNASLTVDKTCNADLELDTSTDPDRVVVKINFDGQVCNTGEVQLTNVSLADNPTATFGSYATTLEPMGDPEGDDCTSYTGYYYPDSIPSADECPFADKVMVTAEAPDNVVLGSGCEENDTTGVVECTAESTLETCDLRATNGDNDCSTGPDSP
jgi:hypothetical protein